MEMAGKVLVAFFFFFCAKLPGEQVGAHSWALWHPYGDTERQEADLHFSVV